MQSHLEAALLGHGNSTSAPANPEEEDKDFQEEEGEEVDEFLDEVSCTFYSLLNCFCMI